MRSDKLCSVAAALGKRQASERPGERLRYRRKALYGPRKFGVDGDLKVSQSDRVPEDPLGKRFLFRLKGMGIPNGPHLFRRQA